MNVTRYSAGLACALLCIPATVCAQVVVLPIAVDGYATRNAPAAVFTLNTTDTRSQIIAVDWFDSFLSARTLYEFDLSPIPIGSTITGISLNVFVYSASQFVAEGTRTVSYFGYNGDGILTVADANAGVLIPVSSGVLDNDGPVGHITIGLDPAFAQIALDAGAFAGLNLRLPPSVGAGIAIATQESRDTPPTLTVTYTAPAVSIAAPEPSVVCLLLPGLVLIGVRPRRP